MSAARVISWSAATRLMTIKHNPNVSSVGRTPIIIGHLSSYLAQVDPRVVRDEWTKICTFWNFVTLWHRITNASAGSKENYCLRGNYEDERDIEVIADPMMLDLSQHDQEVRRIFLDARRSQRWVHDPDFRNRIMRQVAAFSVERNRQFMVYPDVSGDLRSDPERVGVIKFFHAFGEDPNVHVEIQTTWHGWAGND